MAGRSFGLRPEWAYDKAAKADPVLDCVIRVIKATKGRLGRAKEAIDTRTAVISRKLRFRNCPYPQMTAHAGAAPRARSTMPSRG